MRPIFFFIFTISSFAGVLVFAADNMTLRELASKPEIRYGEDRYAPENSTLLYCEGKGKTFILPEVVKPSRPAGTVFEITEPDRINQAR